jgi:hypothetical protein
MNEHWSVPLARPVPDAETAIFVLPLLLGAIHRLAWSGEDEHGDRRRALGVLQRHMSVLHESHPPLAAILDWWMVAALGEKASANAWDVEREIGGAMGERLHAVLQLRGERPLAQLLRPVHFARLLDRLEDLAVKHAAKISPAVRILKEAGSECHTLTAAGREGKPAPKGLRLAGLSEDAAESWAAEVSAGRSITPGTPVFEYVTRSLLERGELVDEALRLWPSKSPPKVELPPTWERDLEAACAPHHALVHPLVADLLAEPPERPLLRPDFARLSEPPPAATTWAGFALAREAYGTAEAEPVGWVKATADELRTLQEETHRLRTSARGQPVEFVLEAEAALRQLDVPAAREWLTTARDEVGKATQDASVERRRAAVQERLQELAAIGEPVSVDIDKLELAESTVNAAVAEGRKRLVRRFDEAADLLALTRRSVGDDVEVAAGRSALSRSLPAALEAVLRAEARATDARATDDARLGPDLTKLRDRIRSRPDRLPFLEVLDVAANRLAAKLDVGAIAGDLEVTLWQKQPASIAVEDLTAREVRRLAFLPAGVRASGIDTRTRIRVRNVWVCGGAPDTIERVRGWGEAGTGPSLECEQTRFYLVEDGRVIGPFQNEGDDFVPEHAWEAVGRLPVARFRALFGAVDLPDGRWLVPYPPSLEDLLAAGAEIRDEMSDDRLAGWLARELDGAPAPDRIASWLKDAASMALPSEVRAARFERMSGMLGRAQELDTLTTRAVTGFLASEHGQGAIAAAAEAYVQRDEALIRDQIAVRQAALQAEMDGLERQRDGLAERIAADERIAGARLAELRAEIADTEGLLDDRRLALFARFAGLGGSATAPSAPAPTPASKGLVSAPIRAARFDAAVLPPLSEVVRLVAGETWRDEEVANLLVSVLTGRWTLLAGLPGVGKSTFVRSVLSRLGHGPGSSRFLELVVRRDWQDDTPLFGFWHPTHHAWEPSSEGFVEHLLRAGDDHANGYGGVYPVLVEELNLASPEYYLARPISALEAAEPTVRLYDPELSPANAARYPSAFTVPESVRLLGTVNVDDTVERLSPRFLSRTSVIWVEPNPDGPTWKPDSDAPRLTARWDTLTMATSGPVGELGEIERLLRFLADRRVPGAPTARTRAAMSRYLGASRGLIDRKRAEDFQILQRVLPPLRGVGPRWRTLLDDLVSLLKGNGWTLSAARAKELRERGEELGDWYDFFHT